MLTPFFSSFCSLLLLGGGARAPRTFFFMWPFKPRPTLSPDARAAALAACDAQRTALAACRAANGPALADRACASLDATLCECLGLRAARGEAAAFGECVAAGGVDCARELAALRAALGRAGLYPPPPREARGRRRRVSQQQQG